MGSGLLVVVPHGSVCLDLDMHFVEECRKCGHERKSLGFLKQGLQVGFVCGAANRSKGLGITSTRGHRFARVCAGRIYNKFSERRFVVFPGNFPALRRMDPTHRVTM